MIVIHDRHPGDNEFLAAVSGLHEQTPSRRHEPAVGDFVSGCTAGKRWQGRVEWVNDCGQMAIDVGGGWVYVPMADAKQIVPVADITH